MECNVKNPNRCCNIKSLFGAPVKGMSDAKLSKLVSLDGLEAYPEEFVPKPPVEFTQEEEVRPTIIKRKKTIKRRPSPVHDSIEANSHRLEE